MAKLSRTSYNTHPSDIYDYLLIDHLFDMNSFTTNPASPADPSSKQTIEPQTIEALSDQLKSSPLKKQLQIIQTLSEAGEVGIKPIMAFLLDRRPDSPTSSEGKAYQVLCKMRTPEVEAFLQTHFPTGLISTPSAQDLDYAPLQELLAAQDFEAADRLTLQNLCELAGPAAVKRKWLYFTEVEGFPSLDLRTIDTLWSIYSENKFGFSKQREIWFSVGQNWESLWTKIAWKTNNNWTRYPNEFIWDLTAPSGHLPLSNQLRGVRVMDSLLNHPAWKKQ